MSEFRDLMAATALAPLAVEQIDSDAQMKEAARYRWMRAAWLEGADTGDDPVVLQAISAVYTGDEMDAAIDAAIAANPNFSARAKTMYSTTSYLIAMRAWYDQRRRAAMAGESFDAPMPTPSPP